MNEIKVGFLHEWFARFYLFTNHTSIIIMINYIICLHNIIGNLSPIYLSFCLYISYIFCHKSVKSEPAISQIWLIIVFQDSLHLLTTLFYFEKNAHCYKLAQPVFQWLCEPNNNTNIHYHDSKMFYWFLQHWLKKKLKIRSSGVVVSIPNN